MELEKLINHIINPSSGNEGQQLDKEILSDADLKKEYARFKNTRALLTSKEASFTDEEIGRNLMQTKKKAGIGQGRVLKLFTETLKYAAVVAITLLVGYQLFTKSNGSLEGQSYSLEVPYGETASLRLPDGTKVWLNSGSTIDYSAAYGIDNRNIDLSGEAYFEVTKNKKVPFVVKTDKMDVEVTGTKFNVTSYPEDEEVYTTLAEGGVNIKNKEGSVMHVLKPGEQAVWDKIKGKSIVRKVNLKHFTSWKDGVLIFEKERLEVVLHHIERWYNVRVVLENESLNNEVVTGALLKNKPLHHILDVLVESTDIKSYKIDNDTDEKSLLFIN
ncbi:DUF4974 domain-containing protein [Puteibacter caeruleilacunae]|nr:DUF4974 domain-containing protein [Puteibacter caeruleilacunae]